jgi:hypothetical protein
MNIHDPEIRDLVILIGSLTAFSAAVASALKALSRLFPGGISKPRTKASSRRSDQR